MKHLLLILTVTAMMTSISSVAQEQPAKLLTTTDVVLNREIGRAHV